MEVGSFQSDVVLVRPQIPENVGLTARAVKAFGLGSLVVVNPAFEWNLSRLDKTAKGSQDLLCQTRRFNTLDAAIAKYHHCFGFSRRSHDFIRPRWDLISWAEQAVKTNSKQEIALLFGPEDFGLATEEKHLCEGLVTIPLQEETLSLNLSQAVTVVLFELSRYRPSMQLVEDQNNSLDRTKSSPVTQMDVQRIMEGVITLLDSTSFFKSGRRERQIEAIRNLVYRLGLSVEEYPTCMGVIQSLLKVQWRR